MENTSTIKCVKGMTKDTCPHNPRLGCDCGLNPPRTSSELGPFKTNPIHGGKITCHKCSAFITEAEDGQIKEFEGVHFHLDCFNRYEHYYGLDKPLD